MNNKPEYLTREGLEKYKAELEELVNVRRAEVATRIHDATELGRAGRERRVRGRQERAGLRRGPDPGAREPRPQRRPDRRAALHRPRPDRLDRRRRSRRRPRGIHHRRLGGGLAPRGTDLERVARRPRPARPPQGRPGPRPDPGRGLHVQDRQHQVACHARRTRGRRRAAGSRPPGDGGPDRMTYWADELRHRSAAAGPRPQVVSDSKTPSGTVHVGSFRGADPRRRHLRARSASTASKPEFHLRRRRHGPHGLPGAPHARRRRSLHGRAAGPRARRPRGAPPRATPATSPATLPRHLRRPRHPPGRLLDERALRRRADGPVPADGARSSRPRSRDLRAGEPTSRSRRTGSPSQVICE